MTDQDSPTRLTNHWTGIGAITLFLGGIALLTRSPGLLLTGVLGVVFAAYSQSARSSALFTSDGSPPIEITREVSETTPSLGDDVTVTVTVQNTGETVLPDLRVIDGVPPGLEVSTGSPRLGTALRPDKRATVSYIVTATRGEHEWEPTQVILRDFSNAIELETTVTVPTTMRCQPILDSTADLPIRQLTTQYAGRVGSDIGGSGIEFHSTREYRSGDPMNRIDWETLAKTNELATREYHEERAVTAVLLIDARKVAYRAPEPGGSHAIERSVDAARQVFATLCESGDRVGIAVFGPEEAWLAPGSGANHRARARSLLATHPSLSPIPPEEELYDTFSPDRRQELLQRRVQRLRRRLPDDTQLFVFSPCCDDYLPDVARRFDAHGYLVTLISPNPTGEETSGHHVARLERDDRLSQLRRAGLRVIDWNATETLAGAIAHAQNRWSQ